MKGRRAWGTLAAALLAVLAIRPCSAQPAAASRRTVAENVCRGELVSFPGPWGFLIGKSGIILVSDGELEGLADPDKVLNLSLRHERRESRLRQVCEGAKAAGRRTLFLAFDHFFSQYRPGQSGPRRLMPDTDEYVQRIAAISRFAQSYGLGLELSLLSPLEIGRASCRERV